MINLFQGVHDFITNAQMFVWPSFTPAL